MIYVLIDVASRRVLQFQDHDQFGYPEAAEGQQLVEWPEGRPFPEKPMVWFVDGEFTLTDPDPTPDLPPAPPPRVVDRRQGRRALLKAGLLATVEAAIDSMPSPEREEARVDWEDARTFDRDSELVQRLASALGLGDAKLDALFADAATY